MKARESPATRDRNGKARASHALSVRGREECGLIVHYSNNIMFYEAIERAVGSYY